MFKKLFSNKKRGIAVVAAVVVVIASLAIGINTALAAKADINVTLAQPNSYPVIEKGTTRDITGSGIRDCESGNTAIATAQIVGNLCRVTGVKASAVSIAVGSSAGAASAYSYQISDSTLIGAYTIKSGGEVYFSGPGVTKSSPVMVTAGTQSTISWSTLNDQVATVSTNGAITSTGKGAAIILGTFTDKWGVPRDIHLLVGVGVSLGQSDLSTLLDLIQKGEAILAENPNPYTTDSLDALQEAVNKGKDVVNSDNPSDASVQDAVKDLQDALSGMEKKPVQPDDVIKGDDGNYYKPVGDPANVYEEVNQDGSSKNHPPTYVYNPDGNPGNGHDRPAYPAHNFYWVEDPAGSNIYKQVNGDGSLKDSPAVWGGGDKVFGTPDDQPVIKMSDGSYWVDKGQNVWQKVTDPTTLGPLTGGGPNKNPVTSPGTPVYTDSNGKYYIGPIKDANGNDIYYGDPVGGNGLLDSTGSGLEGDDVIWYKNDDGTMTTTPPVGNGNPDVATGGRVLPPAKTGDSSSWVEIATSGGYSLIVRANYINVSPTTGHQNDPTWQYLSYGTTNAYGSSALRNAINAWYAGTASGSAVDNLTAGARLRSFTVMNNAKTVLGTDNSADGGLTNGFSKPTKTKLSYGDDVSFALSSCELANFVSEGYVTVPGGTTTAASSQAAANNYGRITIPQIYMYGMWGRTPGDAADTAGALDNTGRTFRFHISSTVSSEKGLVYPALWVDSAIFN
ncbi:MAG: FIVAR domain-containing protein [Coriobacteriia bacterium]|nr:FIVAR domain-containing protein [Coriobacteriia bacterium]